MKVQYNKQINFIPDFMVSERAVLRRRYLIALITFITTLFCFSLYFIPELKEFTLEHQLQNINIEIKALTDEKALQEKLDSIQARVERKRAILQEIANSDVDVLYVINKITSSVPSNVMLSYINISGRDKVGISYSVNSPADLPVLVNRLRELDLFETVSMPNIPIMDKKTDVSFALKLKSGAALRKAVLIPEFVPAAAQTTAPVQEKPAATLPVEKPAATQPKTTKKTTTPTKKTTTQPKTTTPTTKSSTSTTNKSTSTGTTGTKQNTSGTTTKTTSGSTTSGTTKTN